MSEAVTRHSSGSFYLEDLHIGDERAYAIVDGRAKDFDWSRVQMRRTQTA